VPIVFDLILHSLDRASLHDADEKEAETQERQKNQGQPAETIAIPRKPGERGGGAEQPKNDIDVHFFFFTCEGGMDRRSTPVIVAGPFCAPRGY